jgi:hypothetical protein
MITTVEQFLEKVKEAKLEWALMGKPEDYHIMKRPIRIRGYSSYNDAKCQCPVNMIFDVTHPHDAVTRGFIDPVVMSAMVRAADGLPNSEYRNQLLEACGIQEDK